jgi:hypothetical protein
LALGTNDLKAHFSLSPERIRDGVACLVHDILTHDIARSPDTPVKVRPPSLARGMHF